MIVTEVEATTNMDRRSVSNGHPLWSGTATTNHLNQCLSLENTTKKIKTEPIFGKKKIEILPEDNRCISGTSRDHLITINVSKIL